MCCVARMLRVVELGIVMVQLLQPAHCTGFYSG